MMQGRVLDVCRISATMRLTAKQNCSDDDWSDRPSQRSRAAQTNKNGLLPHRCQWHFIQMQLTAIDHYDTTTRRRSLELL